MKIYDNNKNLLGIYINGQDFKNEKKFLTDHSISFQVGKFNFDQGMLYKDMFTINMKENF